MRRFIPGVGVDCNLGDSVGTGGPASVPPASTASLRQTEELLDQSVQLLLSQSLSSELLSQLSSLRFSTIKIGQVTQVRGTVDDASPLVHHGTEGLAHLFQTIVVDQHCFFTLTVELLVVHEGGEGELLRVVDEDVQGESFRLDSLIQLDQTGLVSEVEMSKLDLV